MIATKTHLLDKLPYRTQLAYGIQQIPVHSDKQEDICDIISQMATLRKHSTSKYGEIMLQIIRSSNNILIINIY